MANYRVQNDRYVYYLPTHQRRNGRSLWALLHKEN